MPLLHCSPVMYGLCTGICIELGIPGKSPKEDFQLCSAEAVNFKGTHSCYYRDSVTEMYGLSLPFLLFLYIVPFADSPWQAMPM